MLCCLKSWDKERCRVVVPWRRSAEQAERGEGSHGRAKGRRRSREEQLAGRRGKEQLGSSLGGRVDALNAAMQSTLDSDNWQ
eukprot:1956175-Rhodomonas_salina.2